jgi:methionyl-tRNA synthetase
MPWVHLPSAKAHGIQPKAFCDQVSAKFHHLFTQTHVGADRVIRTTDTDHTRVVQHVWRELQHRGYIYKGIHEGYYSVSDETFFPATHVRHLSTGNPAPVQGAAAMAQGERFCSTETGNEVQWCREENYKFRLGAFHHVLRDWLQQHPQPIVPALRYQEVLSILDSGLLADLSISRPASRLTWGIPVPEDDTQTIYVWLDALCNYLTVSGYPEELNSITMQHVIGKDILKFHAIYWPAFLAALGLPLPERIIAHGHFLSGNMKMSKSKGNVIHPAALLDLYGADATRYMLLKCGSLHADSEFSLRIAGSLYQAELLGQLGNFCKRATATSLNPGQQVHWPPCEVLGQQQDEGDARLLRQLADLCRDAGPAYADYDVVGVLQQVSAVLAEANRWWDSNKPWVLAKAPEGSPEAARLQHLLALAYECMRLLGLVIQPVMPDRSTVLLDALCVPKGARTWSAVAPFAKWEGAPTPISLCPMPALFPRVKPPIEHAP